MTDPAVAARKPIPVKPKVGKEYSCCARGESANQPFCDGSHRGTDFSAVGFTAAEPGEAHPCMCKHTANPPYRDGSHNSLADAPEPAGLQLI